MRTDDFDFDLPEEHIALRPAEPRDSARLLVVRPAAATSASSAGAQGAVNLPLEGRSKPASGAKPGSGRGENATAVDPLPKSAAPSAGRFRPPLKGEVNSPAWRAPALED